MLLALYHKSIQITRSSTNNTPLYFSSPYVQYSSAKVYGTSNSILRNKYPHIFTHNLKYIPLLHLEETTSKRFSSNTARKAEKSRAKSKNASSSNRRVILAEKESVARDIARVLKLQKLKTHYGHPSGKDSVIWSNGHLLSLTDERDIASRKWSMQNLPILPNTMQIKPYERKATMLSSISNILRNANEIVCATDAGREGELIFRLIYNWVFKNSINLNQKSPPILPNVKRLWISSLTPHSIREGLNNLKDAKEFDSLYESALCRSVADWMVGINATQAYSLAYGGKFGNTLLTLGRVQTPVLKMIVDRSEAQKAFKPEDYHHLFASIAFDEKDGQTPSTLKMKWIRDPSKKDEDRIFSQAEFKNLLTIMQNSKELSIRKLTQTKKIDKPPKLYDLTELQREANRSFNWTAKFTLTLLQSLYEKKKFITYPRTNSRYLTRNDYGSVHNLIKQITKSNSPLKSFAESAIASNRLDKGYLAVFDESKVTDHTAIILTPAGINYVCTDSNTLNSHEQRLFDLIVKRIIAVFMHDCVSAVTSILASIPSDKKDLYFTANITTVHDYGWKAIYSTPEKKSSAFLQHIQSLQEGAIFPIHSIESEIKQTKPPPSYTEASLLTAMETAGRELDNEEQREMLAQIGGIGTPATRAEIIEKLLEVGYIQRTTGKPTLEPTQFGLDIIQLLSQHQSPLLSPALTAEWEQQLNGIRSGIVDKQAFFERLKGFTKSLIEEPKKNYSKHVGDNKDHLELTEGILSLKCIRCGHPHFTVEQRAWVCPKCAFSVAKTIKGRSISTIEFMQLMNTGKSPMLHGFKTRHNKAYSARLIYSAKNKTLAFEFV